MTGLVGEALQGLYGRRCHLQPLEAAFEDVDGENDVPVLGCLSLARSGAKSVTGLSRHERPKRLERSIRDAQPLLLALQPEAQGAGGGGLAARAHVADQRQGVDLGRRIDWEQLAALSVVVERPVVQRLGYLLDHLGHDDLTGPMQETLRARGSLPWTELDRQEARDPDFASEPRQRDLRWHVIVRRGPRVDA